MTHLLKDRKQNPAHIKSRVESRLKNGNYKISEEHKKILRTINIGRKQSYEEREKRGKSLKEFYNNPKSKMMLSNSRKKQWQNGFKGSTGKHWSKTLEQLKNKMGEKNPAWKGGITPENTKIRNSIEFRLWREAVFTRDNWTCQKTGIKGGKLHSHHIQNFSKYPELRFAINNGITLSKKAHEEFHKKYGRRNNTLEQLNEFLLNK